MRTYLRILLISIGVAIIIAARMETINLTEGQALIQYWHHWLSGILFMICSLVVPE